ncbi:hypothetical protein [Staphylococcus aureus]
MGTNENKISNATTIITAITIKLKLNMVSVSYTHLRAHETLSDRVCRLLLEKKKKKK